MTREEWLQRFVGAYQAFTECSEEEAAEAATAFEGEEIDLENDCPVESARLAAEEDDGEEAAA